MSVLVHHNPELQNNYTTWLEQSNSPNSRNFIPNNDSCHLEDYGLQSFHASQNSALNCTMAPSSLTVVNRKYFAESLPSIHQICIDLPSWFLV